MAMEMEGPLALWAAGLAGRLEALGYAPSTATVQMRLAGRLSRFLEKRGLAAGQLSAEVVDDFFADLHAHHGSSWPTPKSIVWLVEYLREAGVAPAPPPAPARSAEEELAGRYRRYLVDERGLARKTVIARERTALLFLAEHRERQLQDLSAADVSRFVTRQCRSLTVRSAERLVNCDRRRATGKRDYAILVLLARLGLRAAEIAALRLDDIDWRAGEIVVRGKGHTEERLPLPCDVGEAIAGYLRHGRPRRPEREMFLRASAPLRGLAPEGVSEVVRAASERAGLGSFGAHRLRHTAGTEMLRAGASLPEVAQVLRHRSMATTAIYAKVDFLALRELAMPWPGAAR